MSKKDKFEYSYASTTGEVSSDAVSKIVKKWSKKTAKWVANLCLETVEDHIIPVRVIYNPPYTICYFGNGDKQVAKCTDGDEFIDEVGVMSCIMKQIFSTRSEFQRIVDAGKWQYNDGGIRTDSTFSNVPPIWVAHYTFGDDPLKSARTTGNGTTGKDA